MTPSLHRSENRLVCRVERRFAPGTAKAAVALWQAVDSLARLNVRFILRALRHLGDARSCYCARGIQR
jgi:hypothetical protein